jgi:hypothetical protein
MTAACGWVVALTVHSKLIAGATVDSIPPFDDLAVTDRQIKELKEFVSRHSDFLEIAYSPFDLRRIVHENKLAVIIGSETDDIGNFSSNPAVKENGDAVSRELVRQRLQALHAMGRPIDVEAVGGGRRARRSPTTTSRSSPTTSTMPTIATV